MRRDLADLDRGFDVVIVGAGVYGACLARLVARQGLTVAVLDQGDLSGGVSHSSLKIVHGGFRYIQHLDLPRIRESITAQRAWLRAAPHLVRPMRCVIPAYGYGTRGPLAFAGGIVAFHLAAGHRGQGVAPLVRLPWSGLLSRRSLLDLYPDLARGDLTGGAYWYDAQMMDANRLTLECLQDACDHGATLLNHVQVLHPRLANGRVEGVVARDRLTGREVEVRARLTINAAGPNVAQLLAAGPTPLRFAKPIIWTRNLNLVVRRLFDTQDAVGVGSQRRSDAAIGKSNRLFFVTRWQDCSIVGTSHVPHAGAPEEARRDGAGDADAFFDEIRAALPNLGLTRADIRYVHCGLTPAEDEVGRAKRGTVIDHRRSDGVAGLLTVLGIKWTTAPTVAVSMLPLIDAALDRTMSRAPADLFPRLPGAPRTPRDDAPWLAGPGAGHDEVAWARWVYGSRWPALDAVLPDREGLPADERIFRCRVLYGIEHEMVVRLRDAVFRATDRAERGCLTAAQLHWCADQLAHRFGWDAARRSTEIAAVLEQADIPDAGLAPSAPPVASGAATVR